MLVDAADAYVHVQVHVNVHVNVKDHVHLSRVQGSTLAKGESPLMHEFGNPGESVKSSSLAF
jgi:hypothetical protein